MTEDTTDATAEPTSPPPATDAFTVVANLLALIADERGCQARLNELKAAESAVAKAQRQLARERIEHMNEERRAKEEIEAERKSLAEREKALAQGEASVEARLRALSRPRDPYAHLRQFPGGMVAEPEESLSRVLDPIYGRQPTASDDEMVTVPVPGKGHTLSRSVPKRRPMRRGVEA